jgi:hypothetical protein
LSAEVPSLETLDLKISDSKGAPDPATTHVRRIVIAQAPALFEVACADPSCQDGGHDITSVVMKALRQRQTAFEGEDLCQGSVGSHACGRTLRYAASARFGEV